LPGMIKISEASALVNEAESDETDADHQAVARDVLSMLIDGSAPAVESLQNARRQTDSPELRFLLLWHELSAYEVAWEAREDLLGERGFPYRTRVRALLDEMSEIPGAERVVRMLDAIFPDEPE